MANSRAIPRSWQRIQDQLGDSKRAVTRIRALIRRTPEVDPVTSAHVAGLRHVCDHGTPGIRRLGAPGRFRYVNPDGSRVTDRMDLARITSLAIPPAWTDVWICPTSVGHLQATGRDARRRKQYRYHPRWRDVRDEVKYGRLIAFAEALPRIRRRTDEDLRKPGLPREKVLAAVVQLLEKTLIRVGNEEYARANHSFGLTTLRGTHTTIAGDHVTFEFRGKSGVRHAVDFRDRRLARIVKACRDLPGYELFQYVDADGARQSVDSVDVNAYLHEIAGQEFTAKDFRTWAGTVMAARALAAVGPCDSAAVVKRTVAQAVSEVAGRLGNTPSVCRKCYIHPAVLDAFAEGNLTTADGPGPDGSSAPDGSLSRMEAAVVTLLARRLLKTA